MNKVQQEREEFISRMFINVLQIPIEHIVGSVVELIPRGQYYFGLCPFHPDTNIGSFVVTPEKGLWRCFAEGIGGNGISFYMHYYEMKYLDAAFKLALDFGVIRKDEYEYYSKKKYDDSTISRISTIIKKPKKEVRIANPDVIHRVYSAMAKVCRLSDKHKMHLIKERQLKENDLSDYFTFPTRGMNLVTKIYLELCKEEAERKYGEKVLRKLSHEQMNEIDDVVNVYLKELRYVPGFYYDNIKKCIDFSTYKGIGFLVRNESDKVVGIQIRRDVIKPGESRYIWFSSLFASSKENMDGGASSYSPAGIIFPKNDSGKKELCLTEGRFKAEKIAQEGNIAIYVNGVSTWKSAKSMLLKFRKEKRNIYLAFDSDMMGNTAVHIQLKELGNELERMGYRTKLLVWKKNLGKGFDDLVIKNGRNYILHLKAVAFSEFEKSYDKQLNQVLSSYNASTIRNITPENANAFANDLQQSMEDSLSLS